MTPTQLKTDYLIVGSGAVGMAFADVLVSESDADIIIVDQFAKPGGHWNNAYPFVTLHQPSAFYGVSSRELSNGKFDQVGLNKGLGSLATGAEVAAYFDAVMHETFLPSGRVRYFPMCRSDGAGMFENTLTGEVFEVEAGKTVDATYLKTTVPSTHTPQFEVENGVWFMPLNDLPKIDRKPEGYVIVGGGKTGMDAVLWLLGNSVDPDTIRWIMPRDGWMLDRKNTQSDISFFNSTLGAQALQFEAIAAAESVDDLFDRLEDSGVLLRLDRDVKPKMFHGATVSQAELAEMRRVKNVLRLGRVQKIGVDEILLDQGSVPTGPNIVHVDCSASAISNLKTKPIFEGDLITPQTVRSYQPVFSAALIAHIEVVKDTEVEKNALSTVVPLPNHDTDWIRMMIPFMMNQYNWSRDSDIRDWLTHNRLDGFSGMVRGVSPDDAEKQAILGRMKAASMPAMAKLTQLVGQI
ncbi:hypothetical protein [Amylibacter sp. IMCC11727]|uniref:hypothetical protein n=1 Tax=Amylibacter sp. IMCC11727 TaxID=3039851 RepID=UPI00244E4459|nr:hypothetical protein [Amylibacter sp. IMCC11727]WGI21083.1 hypothetical protein QBD29_13335 [Amylibacter sp. IMCC11727]